jgi:hypothetical protein
MHTFLFPSDCNFLGRPHTMTRATTTPSLALVESQPKCNTVNWNPMLERDYSLFHFDGWLFGPLCSFFIVDPSSICCIWPPVILMPFMSCILLIMVMQVFM